MAYDFQVSDIENGKKKSTQKKAIKKKKETVKLESTQ
jgi:hypothetical protein